MKPVYIFTVLILVPYLTFIEATTSSLVLTIATSVIQDQNSTYRCTSEGDGNDPTLVWSIRKTDGTTIKTNSQLSSVLVAGSSNTADGEVTSQVTFLVLESYLTNHRLWCGAIESGQTSTSMTIYTGIDGTDADLGESCSSTVSCADDNAGCVSSVCRCDSGYYDTNGASTTGGSCNAQVSLGAGCPAGMDAACSTANAGCVSSVCRCDSGYYDTNGASNSGGSCSAQVGLGSTCTAGIDESCSTANARCSATSPYQCECASDYVQSGSTCIPSSVFLGESCVSPSRTCYIANSYCNGSICVCNTGYYRSGDACVQPATYGATCTNPTRTCATTNAECSGNTCSCKSGYTYSSSAGYCISSLATYGASCTNPTRTCTTTNAECSGSTCSCKSGYTYSSSAGYCISSLAGYQESCTNPTRSCPTNAFCNSGGTCACNSNYVYSTSLTYCISSLATYGATCTNPTRTCNYANSECSGGTCSCLSGYTYSTSSGNCITSSALNGQSCVSPTRTCVTNAGCTSGTCSCLSGYIQASTSSCVKPIAGQTCTTSVGCAANSGTTTATATCSSTTCVCPSGYYATSGVCYIRASLGNSCNTAATTPCSDSNAACTGSPTTCQCNSGYSSSGGSCVQDSTSSTSCPSGSSSSSTVTGASSPSTPSVTVGQTCYTVNLQSTRVMECKGTGTLLSARWLKLPNYATVVISTGRFINGDIANPNLTVSNTETGDAGYYVCQLCHGTSYTRCTNSSQIQLIVNGTIASLFSATVFPTSTQPKSSKVTLVPPCFSQAITAVSATVTSTTPLRDSTVTFTCTTTPAGAATSYKWLLGSTQVSTSATYTISSIGTSQDGTYKCEARNSYSTVTSSTLDVDVQYVPEPSGGSSITISGNFDDGDITITCSMTANPSITTYYFYDSSDNVLQSSSSNTYSVTSSNGYQTYSCKAQNSRGLSSAQTLDVVEDTGTNTGAATEDTGIGTGTIAAIVLGIIFLLLLIIIIIVCCCSYGWCRKKEKVEPQVIIERPIAKPYIPRTIVSASSTVSRKDVGVMMNGYRDASVSTEFEEPRYTTPRYHLKPAVNGGPIISMYDDGYDQPRAHQLPALDTQYLYTDTTPRKHKKKKRRRRHEDVSPRRHHYEPEPEPDVRYAQALPASDEDLVVVPGKQNYFE